MKIVMIGAGYAGLVTGACLSAYHNVICVDKDLKKIEALKKGEIPIYEPGLNRIVAENVEAGRLSFSAIYEESIPGADAIFIAVGTPTSRRGDGYADLSYVYAVAEEIAKYLKGYTVVINKSTVPVGTAENVKRIIKKHNPEADFDIVSNPEFLREGSAIKDFQYPDRIIVGAENKRAEDMMRSIYKPLSRGAGEFPMLITNPQTAELTKYAANAFLATKISFMNEMANLCEAVGANAIALARGMGMDNRIGKKFLNPGPGYGGSCFPKDTKALMRIAQEHGSGARIVETVVEVNAAQKARMVRKIRTALGGKETDKTIAVLGLTFKPETDDMRESPSIAIISALVEKGANIKAHDPHGMKMAKEFLPKEVNYCGDPYEACQKSDCIVLLTEWNDYRALDLERIRKSMRTTIFIDLRNVYDPEMVKNAGFEKYVCVGKKDS